MGFNYTIIIYIIVLSGLIYAIFIAFYFEAKLSHQSNKAKANILTGVFISLYTLTGLSSLLSSFSNSMIIRYGFPTLFAAEQLVGIIFFLRYFRETRRWLNKNANAVTLIFKKNRSAIQPKRIVVDAIDGVPNGKGIIHWIYKKCLISPGTHQFKLRVIANKKGRSYGEDEFLSYETQVKLLPGGKYYIEEDLEQQCINITPLFHIKVEYSDVEPQNKAK